MQDIIRVVFGCVPSSFDWVCTSLVFIYCTWRQINFLVIDCYINMMLLCDSMYELIYLLTFTFAWRDENLEETDRMRNRSNSGVRLDYYQRLLNKTILKYQVNLPSIFGGFRDIFLFLYLHGKMVLIPKLFMYLPFG